MNEPYAHWDAFAKQSEFFWKFQQTVAVVEIGIFSGWYALYKSARMVSRDRTSFIWDSRIDSTIFDYKKSISISKCPSRLRHARVKSKCWKATIGYTY